MVKAIIMRFKARFKNGMHQRKNPAQKWMQPMKECEAGVLHVFLSENSKAVQIN